MAAWHARDHRMITSSAPNDLDIYRCARLLIERHGTSEAARHALQRGIELEGDLLGQAVWMHIFEAVKVLARERPNTGEHIH